MLPVVEHRTVDDSIILIGKVLEVLVMRGYHAPHVLGIEACKHRLGYRTSYLWLSSPTELINQHQRVAPAIIDEKFHVHQVRAICAQVVLYRLLVAYIQKNILEYAYV